MRRRGGIVELGRGGGRVNNEQLQARVALLESKLRTIAEAHRMVKTTIDDESTWTIACDARDMILDEVEALCLPQ